MKRRLLTVILFVALAVAFVLPERIFKGITQPSAFAQTKPRTQARRPAQKPSLSIDYSKFSHATKKHQQECSKCHSVPSGNWQKIKGFPDVADYPGHETCVGCHRQQFFKGATPIICTVCHSKSSPRSAERFPFRNPSSLRQFKIEFPHNKHQDVIALWPGVRSTSKNSGIFVTASFRISSDVSASEQGKGYNNCEICHGIRKQPAEAPPGGWTDGFVPRSDTFKTSPVGHADCFNCHWKGQPPTNEKCEGCHRLTSPFRYNDSPKRISIKFRHEGGGERKTHLDECTTCHINITKAASLMGLKADVPITACTRCHNAMGLRLDLNNELETLDKDRNFVCVYCHTSNVGRRDAPTDHYLVAERPALLRKDLK